MPLATDPRLTRKFREWEFRIFGTGNQLRIRVFVNANGSSEEYAFDNIRVCAEDSLSIFDLSINNDSFIESAVEGELTIALDAPAPTGGVVFTIEDSDINDTDADLPSSVTVPEGENSATVDFDILHDQRFDGDEPILVFASSPGFARERTLFTVENIDRKPNVVINEFYPVPFDDEPPTELQGGRK